MLQGTFRQMLEACWSAGTSVCVGLDTDTAKIPAMCVRNYPHESIIDFNCAIIDATKDLVCCYKPNSAFYEGRGEEGIVALKHTIQYIRTVAPGVPVILDAKRADIDSTNMGYVHAIFDYLGADAITVHPYLGAQALKPFLERKEKGVIVLCRTSNPGAGEFQDLPLLPADPPTRSMPLYQYVAQRVARFWNQNGNCALVVGATYPDELRQVRGIVGDMPLLIPGIGFQQKDVPLEVQTKLAVMAGKDSRGKGMIINSSRGILYASKEKDFAEAARRETLKLRDMITNALKAEPTLV